MKKIEPIFRITVFVLILTLFVFTLYSQIRMDTLQRQLDVHWPRIKALEAKTPTVYNMLPDAPNLEKLILKEKIKCQ